MSANCCIVPLHNRVDLLEDCCSLLNSHWNVSETVRKRFLLQSNEDLPYSLVLLQKIGTDQKLVGHARFTAVVGDCASLLLSSVIITQELRSQGFGKRMMQLIEEFAVNKGYKFVYLNSKDATQFYKKCGYIETTPVETSHSKILLSKMSELFKHHDHDEATTVMRSSNLTVESNQKAEKVCHKKSSVPMPPPLPPPVPLLERPKDVKVWLRKNLVNIKLG